MIESSLKVEQTVDLLSQHVLQIVEIILGTHVPSDSLDASTLLLSLSGGSDSIALQFFSAYPSYQIMVLSRFPITDPACLPILKLFINMTSHECFAESLTIEAIEFFASHSISKQRCPAIELICNVLNNLTCNKNAISTINDLMPCFLSHLISNSRDCSDLDYLIRAIGNSCTLESSRLALTNSFPLFMHFLCLSMDVPRIFPLSSAILKNCMFQSEFREAFTRDESTSGIRFIVASLLLPNISSEDLAGEIPELFPILPCYIQGEQGLRSNLEALLLLCTDISGRIFLRNMNIYALLKRVHLLMMDELDCKEIINDIVSLLVRDEET